ncbi:hypothetical protein HPO96_24765 [Kribbella sandramycini]|uniref:ATP-grasp domain-containing protein n=1 Tax=Kribbella sandramycini TaxID=60450 RepID=A0A7Y4P196_9ACTN|nr:hypothetical protein [Kribbella sandramycini]MBB6571131.1 hypothetical protein [Kribbella sandramycini]NOL43461.1 hypothetical protein [Kribbella sandramycini]
MTIRFGTFGAEAWWRPDDLAELPSVGGRDSAVDAMDELLLGFCAPGDLLITRYPIHPELLANLGHPIRHQAVGKPEAGPVERSIAADDRLRDAVLGAATVTPFAVLPDTARLVGQSLPSAEVVAQVNSKTWSNELVLELGLPGAGRVVRTPDELVDAVTALEFRALVKDPYGVSGRALLEVTTPGVLRAVERVLRKQADAGRRVELLVQEKLPKLHDFSGHFELAPDGTAEFLGLQQMTNKGFRHLGSHRPPPALVDAGWYADSLAGVTEALAAAGYWGPVGIDAMLLTDGSVVPVLEINARQSLGLLTLQLDQRSALTAHLWQLELNLAPGEGITDVLTAFDGLLSTGDQPGVLVLNGSTLAAPGGRVYLAIFCRTDDLDQWRRRLVAAVNAAGLTPRGMTDAA